MEGLFNCPKCDQLFIATKFRDVCQSCFMEEEKIFEKVYQYIRRRENRMATITQVIEDTGVDEQLLLKFIKTGRLKLAQYPNLGHKCERCSTVIREGKLCLNCTDQLRRQLDEFEHEEKRRQEIEDRERNITYYINEQKKKKR